MVGKYKYWLQFKLINLGVSLLPEDMRTQCFLINCLKTKHINLKGFNANRFLGVMSFLSLISAVVYLSAS